MLEPTAFPTSASNPRDERALSRISEHSSSEKDNNQHQQHQQQSKEHLPSPHPATGAVSKTRGAATGSAVAGSEVEDDEDTMSEPNYTTSEDGNNPPSLNSDLPENGALHQQQQQHQQHPSVMEIVRECGVELGAEIEFPSPPSSLGGEGEENQHQVTEFTQIEPDSVFLEVTPPEFQADEKDADQEGERKDRIPYDLSISSENNVTKGSNGNDGGSGGGGDKEGEDDSDASLHDSMEILEEVATVDHFERDEEEEEEDQLGEVEEAPIATADAFEMAPMEEAMRTQEAEEEEEEGAEGGQATADEKRKEEERRKPKKRETIVTEEVIL